MDIQRTKSRLTVENSKNSVNTDTFLKINVDSEERLLPPGDIINILSSSEQFDKERQSSRLYRILGAINLTATNALFNLSNSQNSDLFTWRGFNYEEPNSIPPNYRFNNSIYPNVIDTYLKEQNGWFGYFDPDISKTGFCNFFDMEPKRERFSFLSDTNPFNGSPNEPSNNWELTVTYPASIDSGHTMVNNGLLIVDAIPVVVSNRSMTAIAIPCFHNLIIGDSVLISGTNGYDGEHVVVRTGMENGDMKPYYFIIDVPPTGTVSGNSRMKRLFGGVESKYYFRKFRRLKTIDGNTINKNDYNIYKLGFSENYYNEPIPQFIFNDDIDVKNLKDNLGRPISELYLTVLKTRSNDLFGLVSSGIETPYIPKLNTSETNTYLLDVPVINKIHNSTNNTPFQSHIPLETNITFLNGNNDFYGDLVEYNDNQLREFVLADVTHRFNTVNRETPNQTMTYIISPQTGISPIVQNTVELGPRQEGYYYKPHNLIRIRQFSNYIEQGDSFTINIPDYAVMINSDRYLWRDLIDIGFTQLGDETLDYPFVNGRHYLYNNFCINLKRQDPFGIWGLYYSNYPADPLGVTITDNFIINFTEDVC
jgi:hypothetical protein